ncbi:uncharacterized protein BDZ99DRAFT_501154 [Mytilinidion resinicola]|uniref:Uncharacterized protein n=1 Tax=Mytilinidion resinicola TaxID=574789 RepID=A0A6A6YE26_9PEZI|nr:uncharacterized protein BDZ99DRAFT_501154 [Mytilinidion resinicola]KAF2806254.1 hypothetical protein BDZ99DRAFT_501154 [Mytilinidion resinicola]
MCSLESPLTICITNARRHELLQQLRSNSGQGSGRHMSLPISLPETAITHSNISGEIRLSNYVDFVKSCYRSHPEAFSYYEQLVDHLGPSSKKPIHTSLEKPKLFEAWPASPSQTYPVSFPFESQEWDAHSERPRPALLEGFPSPDTMLQLGARWNLRPEFFIEHIFGNNSTNNRAGFYGRPTLPSRQDNIMRIQFTSSVRSLVEGPSMESYVEKRLEIEEACRQCEKDLFSGKCYGATRFREIYQQDAYYCSIEQTISFTVIADRKP